MDPGNRGTMLWSLFLAMFTHFRRKIWRFSWKSIFWTIFWHKLAAVFWVKLANYHSHFLGENIF
jgi:hypothetical protein